MALKPRTISINIEYPYIKVTGCLSVLKGLANRWNDVSFIFTAKLLKVLFRFKPISATITPKKNPPKKNNFFLFKTKIKVGRRVDIPRGH